MADEEVPAIVPAPEAETEIKTRLTDAQWAEIVERAELGTSKPSELAREFGISPQAVSGYFKRNGVTAGSRKHEIAVKTGAAATAAAVIRVATFEEQRKQRIEDTKNQHYQWVEMVEKQIMKKFVDCTRAGDPISKEDANIRTLNNILKSFEIGRKERYAILDVENSVDPESLPEIHIRDLTEEQMAEMRASDTEIEELDDIIDDEIIVEGEDGSA